MRTNTEVKKHKGLSMIIVPMDTPGIEVQPLHLMGEHEIGAVHYDDVRVPAGNLVGGENNGWTLITNQLNHERVTLCSPGMVDRALTEVRQWAQETQPARRPPGHRPGVGAAQPGPGLRRLRVPAPDQLEGGLAGRERASCRWPTPAPPRCSAPSSTSTPSGWLFEILGEPGYLKTGSPGALLRSRLEHLYRGLTILTFGGGTNEIQRDLIGVFGLDMPMATR